MTLLFAQLMSSEPQREIVPRHKEEVKCVNVFFRHVASPPLGEEKRGLLRGGGLQYERIKGGRKRREAVDGAPGPPTTH